MNCFPTSDCVAGLQLLQKTLYQGSAPKPNRQVGDTLSRTRDTDRFDLQIRHSLQMTAPTRTG